MRFPYAFEQYLGAEAAAKTRFLLEQNAGVVWIAGYKREIEA